MEENKGDRVLKSVESNVQNGGRNKPPGSRVRKLRSRKLIAIDLFSGCGGLTTGLKSAGFHVVGAIEIDPLSIATYKLNHPEVKVWPNDIRKVTTSKVINELRIKKGQLDLLAGCPPCQGFSSLTTKNGKLASSDPRNNLIYEFLRFAKKLKPKSIMLENVKGLIDDNRFRNFVTTIKKMGYIVDYSVLDAAKYGVPQRRKRLILIASLKDGLRLNTKKYKTKNVYDAIGNLPLPGKSDDPLHDNTATHNAHVQDLINRIPKNGGSLSDVSRVFMKCRKNFDGFYDVYGRMSWTKVSPTITSGCINPSKGRFLHPMQNRAISIREASLLQTFPKTYLFSSARGRHPIAEMIGNALPPLFIQRHASVIFKHLKMLNK